MPSTSKQVSAHLPLREQQCDPAGQRVSGSRYCVHGTQVWLVALYEGAVTGHESSVT